MLHAVLRPGNPVGNTHQGYRKLVFFGVIWYITPAGNLRRIRVLVYFQVMFIGNPFFTVFFVIQVYCHVNPIPLKKRFSLPFLYFYRREHRCVRVRQEAGRYKFIHIRRYGRELQIRHVPGNLVRLLLCRCR